MAFWLLTGVVAGAIATAAAVVFVARSRMIEVTPSPFASVDETVAALEQGVEQVPGWNSPGTRDLNGMLARHGVRFAPAVRLVEMMGGLVAGEEARIMAAAGLRARSAEP
jgi:hypothetical protein